MSLQLEFTSFTPDIKSLVCLRYSSSQSEDPIYSDFSLTNRRCRQLLLGLPEDVVACPRPRDRGVLVVSLIQSMYIQFSVCVQVFRSALLLNSYFGSQLTALCGRLQLNPVTRGKQNLSPSLLEECISFTIKVKLAPAWIKVSLEVSIFSPLVYPLWGGQPHFFKSIQASSQIAGSKLWSSQVSSQQQGDFFFKWCI